MPWPAQLSPLLDVLIPGDPVGQGSMTVSPAGGKWYPKTTVAHRNATVEILGEAWHGQEPHTGPVAVAVELRLTRPAGHYWPVNTRRPERVLRDDAPQWCVKFPDVDKGARLILDALKIAGVLRDDKLVADLRAVKRWAATGSTRVVVTRLETD